LDHENMEMNRQAVLQRRTGDTQCHFQATNIFFLNAAGN